MKIIINEKDKQKRSNLTLAEEKILRIKLQKAKKKIKELNDRYTYF